MAISKTGLPDRLPKIQLGVDFSSPSGANGTVALHYFWAYMVTPTTNKQTRQLNEMGRYIKKERKGIFHV